MYFWWKKKFIYNKKKNTSITFEVRGVLKWMAVTYYFYKKENIIDQTFHLECPVYLGTTTYFVHPCPTIDTSLLYVHIFLLTYWYYPFLQDSVRQLLSTYLHRFSSLAGPVITCGPVLNWLELDNRGHRLIVTEDCAINTPAVAAAYATKRYAKQANDEISFEVSPHIY